MSTNSTISILNDDGTVNSIYCHWDGHIESNGQMLKEHYTNVDKVKELIALGDISSLDKECSKPEGHSFDNRIDGYTVAYHRDRDESWDRVKPEIFGSFEMFRLSANFQEFNYLYKNGKWVVMVGDNRKNQWIEY